MSNFSKLGILCLTTLCFLLTKGNAMDEKSETLVDQSNYNQTLDILEPIPEETIPEEIMPKGQINTHKSQDNKEPANVINTQTKDKTQTHSNISIHKSNNINEDETSEFTSNINEFFDKYKNPEFLVIMECDGLTQSIHLANVEKAITNLYWGYHKNLGIINKVNKWVGISYGCTLAGANVGTLVNSNDIEKFNSTVDDIIEHLKQDRINRNSCCTKFTDCIFNCCFCCFKCCAKDSDINIIRESQFDQASSSALQLYIKNYFPREVLGHLVFLQNGKDRRRIDPDYQSSYVAAIESVNNIAQKNKRGVVRKNIGFVTDTVATVADKTDIPIIGKIAEVTGKVITGNLEFKSIDNSKNISAYQEMSGEVLDRGTLKLILNVDNIDAPDLSCDLRIEHKKDAKKLKYRLTVNIPTQAYQDTQYNFEDGHKKILNYLNEKRVNHYLVPVFNFINSIPVHDNKSKD